VGPVAEERLVVYWRPGCPYSARLRARLRLSRVPYTAVNIHEDPDAAALVREHNGGDELVPTVRLDGDRWFSNPSWRDLRAALAG
jgi:mycoredoxin